MRVVYCEWYDALADTEWKKSEDVESCHIVKSVGFVVRDTKKELVLAAAMSDGESNARIIIPKAWIKKRKRVRL